MLSNGVASDQRDAATIEIPISLGWTEHPADSLRILSLR